MLMSFRHEKFITRSMMRNEPDTLFCFGDNLEQKGFGGQAKEMRGEPNAIGIPTKRKPSNAKDAFFTDDDYPEVWPIIFEKYELLRVHMQNGGDVVWPADNIGTGLAKLETRSPLIWAFLQTAYRMLLAQGKLTDE